MLIHAWPFLFGCGLSMFNASHFICSLFCIQRPLLWIWAYVIHSFLRNWLFFGGVCCFKRPLLWIWAPSFVFSNKETLCFRTHVALNQKQKQANVDNHCVSSSVSVFGRAAGYTFLNSVSLFWRASLQKCPRGPWPFSLQFLYRETKTWLLLGPFSGAQFWDGVPFFSCSVSGHLFKWSRIRCAPGVEK